MAEKSLGFWGTTISGVIAALAGAGLLWVIPDAWQWSTAKLSVLAAWLSQPVAVPLWAVVLLALCAAIICWQFVAAIRGPSTTAPTTVDEAIPEPPLSGTEQQVFQFLVAIDGKWVEFEDLAHRCRLTNIILTHTLEKLDARNFIDHARNSFGPKIALSREGREYAIHAGMVPVVRHPGQ